MPGLPIMWDMLSALPGPGGLYDLTQAGQLYLAARRAGCPAYPTPGRGLENRKCRGGVSVLQPVGATHVERPALRLALLESVGATHELPLQNHLTWKMVRYF